MNQAAGKLDRRVTVEAAVENPDAAGDEVKTWTVAFHRWAAKSDAYGREIKSAQQLVRDVDTIWTMRYDTESRSISPELHRFLYLGTVYEIVSISEGSGRFDTLDFLTASRPDLRGDRGRDLGSGQP